MLVSEPKIVRVEIEDTTTGCSYIYTGKCVKDCEDYFLSLFFGRRPHKILWVEKLS